MITTDVKAYAIADLRKDEWRIVARKLNCGLIDQWHWYLQPEEHRYIDTRSDIVRTTGIVDGIQTHYAKLKAFLEKPVKPRGKHRVVSKAT